MESHGFRSGCVLGSMVSHGYYIPQAMLPFIHLYSGLLAINIVTMYFSVMYNDGWSCTSSSNTLVVTMYCINIVFDCIVYEESNKIKKNIKK